ncbi:hypothetical protein Pmani_013717 [Petrolisthes manimaculis]|uniref:Uncharacterized protein n=1 Tax=Petrolisthes manimaculis TaxID=1843537 RepID=A0AAE1UDU4_9EUCA|nr:hypothetical protein Pmani_013717 [Petrolisthes manimaculis]
MLEAQQGNSNAGGGVLSLLSSMEQRGGLVLNPPLAALTTMADMKTLYAQGPAKSLSPQSPQQVSPQLSPQEMVAASYCGATMTTSSLSTPHNIESILSRPGPLTPTSTGLCGMGQMGSVGLGRLGAGVGLYGGLAGKMADLARPSSLYWPGVQGMLQNPLFWRERLQATHVTTTTNNNNNNNHTVTTQRRGPGKPLVALFTPQRGQLPRSGIVSAIGPDATASFRGRYPRLIGVTRATDEPWSHSYKDRQG